MAEKGKENRQKKEKWRDNVKKTQWIYKGIAALLALALIVSLLSVTQRLRVEEPIKLSGAIQDIQPEAEKPIPGQINTDDDDPSQQQQEQQQEEQQETDLTQNPPPETEEELPEPPDPEQEEAPPEEVPPKDEPEPDDEGGGSGDTDDNETGEEIPSEGPEDDSELRIVTDLYNGEITFNELENDILPFYAYLINAKNGETLRVKIINSKTPANGKYLNGDGKNFEATLCRNESNRFILYIKEGEHTLDTKEFVLEYVAQKADEENPEIGKNPPSIVTNLEGVTKLSNRNFTLTVQATAYTGRALYFSNIEVRLDGELITNPTGGPRYEYQLYFKDPDVGDVVHHTVTVRAWDDEGNSAFRAYDFDFLFVDTGGEIGTAYIYLDATTVGLGVLDGPYEYTIKQNVPASYAVMEMLTEFGYEFTYAGTPDVGFYLRRIHSGGMMDYPDIPGNLWDKILQDGLTLTGQHYPDSLGEFDFTQGSGWMYSVGGEVYAGKGLSNYFLSDGDTMYLRFTLAYGKDIGGYSSTGGNFGVLSTYCGKWINDSYIDMHSWEENKIIKEATCTEEGEMSCVCSVCGDQKDTAPISAFGHDYEEVERVEPLEGTDGYVLYECANCEEAKKETIPWKEESTEPEIPTEPETPTEPEIPTEPELPTDLAEVP